MGILADAVLANGGKAIGVIPRALWDREVGHRDLTELHVVETMHERKAMMASLADAFVALPGGLGTLEEIFEVWTWAQLGIHAQAARLSRCRGFYAPLMAFLDRGVDAGFVRAQYRAMAIVDAIRRHCCGVCRSTSRRWWRSGSAQRRREFVAADSIAVFGGCHSTEQECLCHTILP